MGYGLLEQLRDLLKHAADEKRDTFFTAKEVIALVEADVSKRLLSDVAVNAAAKAIPSDPDFGQNTWPDDARIALTAALAAIGIEPSHE